MRQFDYESFPSVSMMTFLKDYVGEDANINEAMARKLAKATHKDLKELNIPFVKAVPFDILTTDDLLMGKYILVYDGKSTSRNKRIAPYVRPELLKQKALEEHEFDFADEIENEDDFDLGADPNLDFEIDFEENKEKEKGRRLI